MWTSLLLARAPRLVDTISTGIDDSGPWVDWLKPDYWPDSDNISGPFRNPGTTGPEDTGLLGAEFMLLYPGTYDFSLVAEAAIPTTVKLSLGIAGGSTVPTVGSTIAQGTGVGTITTSASDQTITDFTVIGLYIVTGGSTVTLTITRKA